MAMIVRNRQMARTAVVRDVRVGPKMSPTVFCFMISNRSAPQVWLISVALDSMSNTPCESD
jgi:hypothetical protein